jgi:hypothetical protein
MIKTILFYYRKGATIQQAIQAAKELWEEIGEDG